MDETEMQQAEADIIDKLQELFDTYGPEPVLQELKKHFPAFDFRSLMSDANLDSSGALPLQENPLKKGKAIYKSGKWLAGKTWSFLKGILPGAAVVGAQGLKTASDLTMGAAKAAIGKAVDQDVNIAAADVTLQVTNPTLEDLMAKTNELLALMARQTADDLEALDLSMDHMVSAATGKSVADVQGQQATGAVPRSDARYDVDPADVELEDEEEPQAPPVPSKARA